MTVDPVTMKGWKSPSDKESEKQLSSYDLDIEVIPRKEQPHTSPPSHGCSVKCGSELCSKACQHTHLGCTVGCH
ncbi:MAG: hypothetical protein K1000chlam2_00453 [Chlamydiae bacterium]|nr:hypothetical protein [Chlamydiota bacterium]